MIKGFILRDVEEHGHKCDFCKRDDYYDYIEFSNEEVKKVNICNYCFQELEQKVKRLKTG